MISNNPQFWKKKRVLVTGHQGFLGSWLAKHLVQLGARVIGVDIAKTNRNLLLKKLNIKNIQADVVDLEAIKRAINKYKPEIVFHLAAQAIVGEAVKIPLRTFKSNIEGTWNILEAIRNKSFIKVIIIASSDKAYGSQKKLPYKEDMPLQGNYPYDVSKSCADSLAYTYFKTYGVPVCVTRCGNIYGPGDLHFSRLVPDAISSAIKNKMFKIRSDGKFTRDYIFVEDVVRGYLLLAEKMNKLKLYGESFNFSNEKPLSVLEMVKTIYRCAGKKPNLKILNQVKYEIPHQYLSAKKAKDILGWRPRYDLKNGLEITINWHRDFLQK